VSGEELLTQQLRIVQDVAEVFRPPGAAVRVMKNWKAEAFLYI